MPTFRNPFTRKDATRGSAPVDGRLALAGLVTPAGDLGVTPGVISGLSVSGRSSAPVWAYSVSSGHAVTTRGATDGASLIGLDGATNTPTVSAAPATGSRWDLIWIRQRDVENGDPDSNCVLDVTSGTPGGSPSKPYGSVPAGALVLAEAQVFAGASNTADPLVIITRVGARVAARGGIAPVASVAQRDASAASGSAANPVYLDLDGAVYRADGSSLIPLGAGAAFLTAVRSASFPMGSNSVLYILGGAGSSTPVFGTPTADTALTFSGGVYSNGLFSWNPATGVLSPTRPTGVYEIEFRCSSSPQSAGTVSIGILKNTTAIADMNTDLALARDDEVNTSAGARYLFAKTGPVRLTNADTIRFGAFLFGAPGAVNLADQGPNSAYFSIKRVGA